MESVSFQSSVCALIQTLNIELILVVKLVTSDCKKDTILNRISWAKEGRTYICFEFNQRVVPSIELNNYLKNRVMHPCNLNFNKQLKSDSFQSSVCALIQTLYSVKPVVRLVTSDCKKDTISKRISWTKEGRTYICHDYNQRVVPSIGLDNYFKNRVMHPCNSNLNIQLESVTFQSSVCALTQTIYSVKPVVRLVTSDCKKDTISNRISWTKEGRTYICHDYNQRVVPSNGLNNYFKNRVMHPCNLNSKTQLESVTFQSSVCALTQTIYLRNIIIDLNLDEYWSDEFEYSDKNLLPLSINNFVAEGKSDVCKYKSYCKTGLFVLDVYKKSFYEVYENDFKRRNLPCFEYKNWVVKYVGSRVNALDMVHQLKNSHFISQGLIESVNSVKIQFMDFLSGISTIFEVIAGIGKTKNMVSEKYDSFREKFIIPVTSNSVVHIARQYGLGLVKIMVSVFRMINEVEFSVISIASLMLDVYDLIKNTSLFQAESLEAVLVAGISSMLPVSFVNIIKKMTLLTNRKLFDDHGFIFEFFSLLSSLLSTIISYFPVTIQDYMKGLLDLFGLSEFVYMQKARKILIDFSKDNHIVLREDFRRSVKELSEEFKQVDLKKFFAKNKPLHDVALEFERIVKAVKSYEQTSRQEPCCFVFQGPPGCRKSVTINKLIKVLGLTHYSHIVKCSEDSKDWYDSYNNEDIFYMDDVGQMGKSQWRNLINWVSAVKLPLDCAEASLKDTKYFNSDLILLTTNNFTNLQGFTSKDCIEHPEALWRRGYVFDFENVKGVGDLMEGNACFKYYDIKTKSFKQEFPSDFKEFLDKEGVILDSFCAVENQNEFLTWLSTIVMGFKKMKQAQLDNNTLLNADVDFVRAANPFRAQSNVVLDCARTLIDEYFVYILDTCKALIGDFMSMIINQPVMAASGFVVSLVVVSMLYKFKNMFAEEGGFISVIKGKEEENLIDRFSSLDLSLSHSLIPKISNQLFEIDLIYSENNLIKTASCHCLISGRKIIVPYHLVLNRQLQVVMYKSRLNNYRIIDHSPVSIIYKNVENDVAILALSDGYPTPFPKLASCFQPCCDMVVGLVFPKKVVKLEGILTNIESFGPIVYPVGVNNNVIKEPILYENLHFSGMCGVLLVTTQGMLMGMHVAGHSSKNVGASLRWSKTCREELYNVLNDIDLGLKINTEINEKIYNDCSALKIKTGLSVFVPKNSNFVKSPLFDVFENTRRPANLSVYGAHTVKDVSKTSRSVIGPVDNDELNFASEVLSLYFENFDDLNEKEIIKGDEMLASINRKSSNGIFPLKNKIDCFDFENGLFKDDFRVLYNTFEDKMMRGDIEVSDIAWSETLKDELRNEEKKEPRSFRVSPVTMQVLTKKCFGKMVKKIVKERWFNEIMIGINPFTEWPKLYKRMEGGRCWGGDIGKYDKNMRVQVQIMVAEVILKFYKGDCFQAAKNILMNIAYNIVVVNDDSWILTHSLPSGCWLTAIFNSLVNRVYTAMWYYREMKSNKQVISVFNFHEDLSDPVYGDDRLNRCKNDKHAGFLNAITMEKFFNSLGMDMTDSLKNKIETPFQDVSELTFLKRYFRFHPDLEEITCPLDLRTVYSTLSWIDKSKENLDVVLLDKINAFQREIFLHYNLYESDMLMLERVCTEKLIGIGILPKQYLINLYNKGIYDDFYVKAYDLLKC